MINYLIMISLLLVLGVLCTGIFLMAKGGKNHAQTGNKLMRARVLFQFIAIIIVMIAIGLRYYNNP